MTEKKPLRKGQAFREYLAVRNQVTEMLANGYDLRYIHQELTGSGKISMSYQSLYYNHCGKSNKAKQRSQQVLPPTTVLASSGSAEARRNAIQDSLSQNLKASEKLVNEAASEFDSEYEEMAKRLI